MCVDCGEFKLPPQATGRPRRRCDECARVERARYARESYARRRAAGGPVKQTSRMTVCTGCGAERPRAGNEGPTRLCRSCRAAARAESSARACPDCGAPTKRRGDRCKPCGAALRTSRYREKSRARRARKYGAECEPYTLAGIAERDSGICRICHSPVNMELSGLHSMGPTIDHIIPLIRGGSDAPGNVQLAHRTCNVRKGAGHAR